VQNPLVANDNDYHYQSRDRDAAVVAAAKKAAIFALSVTPGALAKAARPVRTQQSWRSADEMARLL
jgi:hypothetical protein